MWPKRRNIEVRTLEKMELTMENNGLGRMELITSHGIVHTPSVGVPHKICLVESWDCYRPVSAIFLFLLHFQKRCVYCHFLIQVPPFNIGYVEKRQLV